MAWRPRPSLKYRSRLSPTDLAIESFTALSARPGRAALTAVGTVLGVGTFVVILSLTATLQRQVSTRFDALVATTVNVQDARENAVYQAFPFDAKAEKRVASLHGVQAEGVRWNVKVPDGAVNALGSNAQRSSPIALTAVSATMWKVVKPHLASGRLFDDFHEATKSKVVVLGAAAAKELGITSLVNQPAIYLDREPYTVIGIVDSVERDPDLLLSAVIPSSSAQFRWGWPDEHSDAQLTVATKTGAAQQVASEAGVASSVLDPTAVHVLAPPDPRTLRDAVNTDLSGLFLVLALICLFIGAIGIANTTLVAVVERTSEIGLRRALGARRHHVAFQILTESALLGFVGGLIGSSLGIATVLLIATTQSWAPVVDPWVAFGAPVIGLLTGGAAGAYPAWRATRIEPTEALRR